MNEVIFDIIPEMEDERIDKCICGYMESLSRSYIQKIIKDGNVYVNGLPVKANYKVRVEDKVRFIIPDSVEPDIPAQDIPLDIIYEDSDILIINKPKDMVVHPAPGHYEGTIVNAVMFHCKDALSGINGVMRPGIVHRIDKDTTGSLIICEGIIDAPIGRHPNDRKKMAINETNGKHAITHYKVLERFDKFTYIECRLETGRTHQIRVHMTSLGHPLLGDDVYSSAKSPYKVNGQTLHAMILGFVHPSTKEYMEFEAPLPDYFEDILRKLRKE